LFYQPDVLPTLAELTGAQPPVHIDGLSFLPELIGPQAAGHKQQKHEFLYWEYHSQVAVRMYNFKAIQPKKGAPCELYDLNVDVSETIDIAEKHPGILARMKAFAEQSHVPVRPGTFTNRTRHERDRKAKWGSTRAEANNYQRKVNLQEGAFTPGG
jgi:arylsulfatase A-like enzyme